MDRRVIALIVSAAVLAVVVAVVLIGRGGSDGGSGGGPDLTDTSTKPVVEIPSGPPPTTLETKDIVTGDGPEAKVGETLTVQYVGVDYETGKEFDTSWDDPQPFKFQLGGGQVIPGWDQGIAGMRVGGRRELTIPPDLAYGAQGQPPAIGPNATLIFVIDLVSIGSGTGG
jgi:peptidylprolyl isomerase